MSSNFLDLKTNSEDFNYLLMNKDGTDLEITEDLENWFNTYLKIQKPYKVGDFYKTSTPNFIEYGVNLPLITQQGRINNATINKIENDLSVNVLGLNLGIESIDVSLNKGKVVIKID